MSSYSDLWVATNERLGSLRSGIAQLYRHLTAGTVKVEEQKKRVKVAFETTTPLKAAATYTSAVVVLPTDGWTQVQTEVLADQNGTMVFTFYADDAGADTIRSITVPYLASDGYRQFSAPTFGRAVKYAFTNTAGSDQTDFYFSTKVLTGAVSPQVLAVNGYITPSMMASVQRSVVVGADTRGNYGNVGIDADNNLNVSIKDPTEAFGAVLVSDLHPYVQRKWVQGLNLQQDAIIEHDGGTVVATTGALVLATSTTTSSVATYRSRKIVGYRPGQAVVMRFTMRFTSPGVAGTEQIIGVGTPEDGLFFGYDGETFGVLRRTAGQVEIRTLTITAAASGAGNVTITLNGGAVVVALAGTETIGEVAAKIAAADYSDAGGGWRTEYQGDSVVWLGIDTATRGGSYSFAAGATGVTATGPTQTLAASAATDDWIPQTAWNLDTADGTGTMPLLDHDTLNVGEIQYQWLGAGAILFRLENPVTGRMVNVHRVQFANSSTSPSLRNPDLPMYASVNNGGTTDNLSVTTLSMGGFVAGEPTYEVETRYAADHSKSTDTTRLNILVVRNVSVFGGRTNRKRCAVNLISLGNNSSNRTSQVHVTLNPQLVGAPSWTSVDATNSVVAYDTATTDIVSGTGRRIGTYTVGAASGTDLVLDPASVIVLEPGDILVVSMALASGGTSATQVAALGWSETV